MPTLLKSAGISSALNGLLNMIPWALATLLLLWLPGKLRREHVVLKAMAIVAGLGMVCFAASLFLPAFPPRFIAPALGGACIPLLYSCFWSLPPRFFTGARAAASVAAINSIGNLGGFFGQNLMPYVGKLAGSSVAPMLVPTGCLLVLALGAALAPAIDNRQSRAAGAGSGGNAVGRGLMPQARFVAARRTRP